MIKTAQFSLRKQSIAVAAFSTLLLATALLAVSQPSSAAGGYETIDPPQNTSVADKVEVMEFFWLGCPHCYSFEPTIESWKENKPDHVNFVREAPPLNPSWETHSRAFYAAQLLGHEDEFVNAMFDAIHVKNKSMRKPDDIAELAVTVGMDKDKFLATMNSMAVDSRLKRANILAKGAGISGVPAVVINGKYRTGAQLANGFDGVINTINERVEKERVEMGLE